MRTPPPGMKSMPKNPGETKSQYSDRVRATKPSGRSPVKPVPPAPGGGRGRGGMTPPPGMMYGPDDALIPIPKKGGTPRPRGTSPAPGYGGGKPVRVMPGKTPMRVTGGMGMKSGGTVKGKK